MGTSYFFSRFSYEHVVAVGLLGCVVGFLLKQVLSDLTFTVFYKLWSKKNSIDHLTGSIIDTITTMAEKRKMNFFQVYSSVAATLLHIRQGMVSAGDEETPSEIELTLSNGEITEIWKVKVTKQGEPEHESD